MCGGVSTGIRLWRQNGNCAESLRACSGFDRPAIAANIQDPLRVVRDGWHLYKQTGPDDRARIGSQLLELRYVQRRSAGQVYGKPRAKVAVADKPVAVLIRTMASQ
jgi:hypothetical protein